MQLVLVSGYSSCGKGTALEIFRDYNYNCLDISDDILRPELQKLGIYDIKDMQRLGVSLGHTQLSQKIRERIGTSLYSCVTSIRNFAIYEDLRNIYENVSVVWIESDIERRFERYMNRKREGDSMKTFDEFVSHEERDKEVYNTESLRKKANKIVENNGQKENFVSKVEEIAKYYKCLNIS